MLSHHRCQVVARFVPLDCRPSYPPLQPVELYIIFEYTSRHINRKVNTDLDVWNQDVLIHKDVSSHLLRFLHFLRSLPLHCWFTWNRNMIIIDLKEIYPINYFTHKDHPDNIL